MIVSHIPNDLSWDVVDFLSDKERQIEADIFNFVTHRTLWMLHVDLSVSCSLTVTFTLLVRSIWGLKTSLIMQWQIQHAGNDELWKNWFDHARCSKWNTRTRIYSNIGTNVLVLAQWLRYWVVEKKVRVCVLPLLGSWYYLLNFIHIDPTQKGVKKM